MKKFFALILAIMIAIGVTAPVSVVPASAAGPCISLPTAPVTISVTWPGAATNLSYVLTTISGDSGINGAYEGWCIDTHHGIYPNRNYSANLYCSQDLPQSVASLITYPENLDLANWILNQKFVGRVSPSGEVYTYGDVQIAIWKLLAGTPSQDDINQVQPSTEAKVNKIISLSNLHDGFIAGPGDLVTVIVVPISPNPDGSQAQITLITIPVPPFQGCTPGFWKNNAQKWNHIAWVSYIPDMKFSTVFGVAPFNINGNGKTTISNPTLLEALNANGSGINLLARSAVAALLNASNPNINYALTTAQIISKVQAAVGAGNGAIQSLGEQLDKYNNAGESIDQHGNPK